MAKFQFQKKNGFTLLEMLISTGIFTVVVVAVIGITISISNAHIKSTNIQSIQDNIRFGLELMTKELRTGSAYKINQSNTVCAPNGEGIRFTTSLGEDRIYFLASSGQLMRYTVGVSSPGPGVDCTKATPISSDEVLVERLKFTARGETPGLLDGQPMVTVSARMSSKAAEFGPETSMNLQTTIVQRLRDL